MFKPNLRALDYPPKKPIRVRNKPNAIYKELAEELLLFKATHAGIHNFLVDLLEYIPTTLVVKDISADMHRYSAEDKSVVRQFSSKKFKLMVATNFNKELTDLVMVEYKENTKHPTMSQLANVLQNKELFTMAVLFSRKETEDFVHSATVTDPEDFALGCPAQLRINFLTEGLCIVAVFTA